MTNGLQVGLGVAALAGVVAGGWFFSRPDGDLDQAAAQLESALRDAESWKLPLTAASLNGTPPDPASNAANEVQRLVALNETDSRMPNRTADLRRSTQNDPLGSEVKLAPFELQLKAIDQACERDKVWFKRDWDLGYLLRLDEIGAYRSGARLVASRAEIRAAKGDREGALADVERLARLAKFAGSEPVTISAMSASTIHGIRFSTIRRLAIQWKDDTAVLTQLRASIDDELPRPPLADIARHEAYSALSLLRNFREFGGPAAFVTETHERSQLKPPANPAALLRDGQPTGKFERANLATTLQYWTSLVPQFEKSDLTPVRLKGILRSAEDELKRGQGRSMTIIRELRIPENAYMQMYLGEANRRLTMAYLDAFIHRSRNYKFPAEPIQAYRDPFGTGNIRYQATGNTLKIWSCGPDLSDDGGIRRGDQNQYDEVVEFPPVAPSPPGTMQGPSRASF